MKLCHDYVRAWQVSYLQCFQYMSSYVAVYMIFVGEMLGKQASRVEAKQPNAGSFDLHTAGRFGSVTVGWSLARTMQICMLSTGRASTWCTFDYKLVSVRGSVLWIIGSMPILSINCHTELHTPIKFIIMLSYDVHDSYITLDCGYRGYTLADRVLLSTIHF